MLTFVPIRHLPDPALTARLVSRFDSDRTPLPSHCPGSLGSLVLSLSFLLYLHVRFRLTCPLAFSAFCSTGLTGAVPRSQFAARSRRRGAVRCQTSNGGGWARGGEGLEQWGGGRERWACSAAPGTIKRWTGWQDGSADTTRTKRRRERKGEAATGRVCSSFQFSVFSVVGSLCASAAVLVRFPKKLELEVLGDDNDWT